MKAAVYVVIAVLILSVGPAYAVVPDYLKPVSSEVTPSYTAKIGQGVNARLVLEGTTPVPEEARLNISTSVARPRIEVTIDGKLEWYGTPELEIPLPAEGVKGIEIRVFGDAPEVTKETKVALLDVKTYVKYKGEEGVYQDDGKLVLTVSNVVISGAVEAINTAKSKLSLAQSLIETLRGRGIATKGIEDRLKEAETQIDLAESSYHEGRVEKATTQAELASKSLDRIIMDVNKLQASKETKSNLMKYGLVAAAIIFLAGLILLIRKRREELG